MTSPIYDNIIDPLADPDVTQMTREEAHDYRLQLRHELIDRNGTEELTPDERKFYHKKIQQIKDFLGDD
jgi:hypothetical protein